MKPDFYQNGTLKRMDSQAITTKNIFFPHTVATNQGR